MNDAHYRVRFVNDGVILVKDQIPLTQGRTERGGIYYARWVDVEPGGWDSGEIEWIPTEEGFAYKPEHILRPTERIDLNVQRAKAGLAPLDDEEQRIVQELRDIPVSRHLAPDEAP